MTFKAVYPHPILFLLPSPSLLPPFSLPSPSLPSPFPISCLHFFDLDQVSIAVNQAVLVPTVLGQMKGRKICWYSDKLKYLQLFLFALLCFALLCFALLCFSFLFFSFLFFSFLFFSFLFFSFLFFSFLFFSFLFVYFVILMLIYIRMPFLSVLFKNALGVVLDKGPVTVLLNNSYVGESLMDTYVSQVCHSKFILLAPASVCFVSLFLLTNINK